MSHYRDEHVPELQWLEEGVVIIASHTFRCAQIIVLGLFQLYRQRKG